MCVYARDRFFVGPAFGEQKEELREGLPAYAEDWQLREALARCELAILEDVQRINSDNARSRIRDSEAAGAEGAETRSVFVSALQICSARRGGLSIMLTPVAP